MDEESIELITRLLTDMRDTAKDQKREGFAEVVDKALGQFEELTQK